MNFKMPRNIFIIGPHCTGKTTLINGLEKFFSARNNADLAPLAIIHEVVRQVMTTHHFSAEDLETDRWIELQQCAIEAQIKAEESLTDHWFISDRSVLDPIVYTQLKLKSDHRLRETEGFTSSIERMRNGIVILCEAGNTDWLSSDTTRIALATVQDWEALNDSFKAIADQEKVSYHVLPKDLRSIISRLDFVLERMSE